MHKSRGAGLPEYIFTITTWCHDRGVLCPGRINTKFMNWRILMRTRYFWAILISFGLIASGCGGAKVIPSWPGEEWEISAPEQQGMDGGKLDNLEQKIPTTADIVIIRNGYVLYQYHNMEGYEWAQQEMPCIFSVTKSITSSLIGIAIDEGHIKGVDQKVTDFFPDWAEKNPGWGDITIEHLLTMTAGFDWPEATTWNYSTMPMRETENWVNFVVGREFKHEPGQVFNYTTGGSQLLAAILMKATGQSVYNYARAKLFDPIGIGNVVWEPDPQGIHSGGRGIWISAMDAARFGLLYLNKGNWNGQQIISEEWVETSTQPRIKGWSYAGTYAYHWWTSSARVNGKTYEYFYGLGYAGQLLFVVPDLDIVAMFTAQNPQNPMVGKNVFDSIVLGAVKK